MARRIALMSSDERAAYYLGAGLRAFRRGHEVILYTPDDGPSERGRGLKEDALRLGRSTYREAIDECRNFLASRSSIKPPPIWFKKLQKELRKTELLGSEMMVN